MFPWLRTPDSGLRLDDAIVKAAELAWYDGFRTGALAVIACVVVAGVFGLLTRGSK